MRDFLMKVVTLNGRLLRYASGLGIERGYRPPFGYLRVGRLPHYDMFIFAPIGLHLIVRRLFGWLV